MGLGDAVVLFWCLSNARPFILGGVIVSSRQAPMLLTLHLCFEALTSASASAAAELRMPRSRSSFFEVMNNCTIISF